MKTLICSIVLFAALNVMAQERIGYVSGDTNSVANTDKDFIHTLLGVTNLQKLFTTSFTFSILSPADTLWVRIGNDTVTTAGGLVPVYPGIPVVFKNVDVLYNKFISIIARSNYAARKNYLYGIGGF